MFQEAKKNFLVKLFSEQIKGIVIILPLMMPYIILLNHVVHKFKQQCIKASNAHSAGCGTWFRLNTSPLK